jgi:hypothetical protein
MRKLFLGLIAVIVCISACQKKDYSAFINDSVHLHETMKNLTDVIVHDIFSPPVASRIYVYPSIAAYEILAQVDPNQNSLAGQLHGLGVIPQPPESDNFSPQLAAIYAFHIVGKALVFSDDKMDAYWKTFQKKVETEGLKGKDYDYSIAYGQEVANHILAWADKDKYKETRSYPKYSISDDPSKWQPTPPAYMDGIEPHWREIRLMVLDSAEQFTPLAPTPFNMEKNSKFYEETMEVYNTGKNAGEEEIEIASFWDCNPYVMNVTGHVMYASKKITPGGHWIGITAIACKKTDVDLMKTSEAYALTSIALFDGFISCWDEKYRSSLIRPETVINQYIDEEWDPILQTPPFPEHTSGHSVISTAAAVVLTRLFGENFAFDDDVEVEYGLPVRSFNSFIEASEEAAISRLYGGIHYMPAITYGQDQGRNVGLLINERIQLKS